MTLLTDLIRDGLMDAPDVFCGGTPCQAFSVAGLRKSLNDARGNLSLVFCEIANAIDDSRAEIGSEPCVVFWENVPGVLSTADNAFGCFLAGLAGEDQPLVAPGGKWSNAGYVLGPKRAVAWRVLDAQYFGVAQRRRRVFVVASARDGFDPAAVLFEFDGLRRDTAPSREAWQGTARGIEIGPSGGGFTELNPTLDTRAKDGPIRNQLAGAVLQPVAHAPEIARCIATREGSSQDYETTTMVAQPVAFHPTQDPISSTDGTTHAMGCGSSGGAATVAVAFAENSRHEIRLEGGDGSRTGTLSTGGGKPGQGTPMVAVAHSVRLANTSSNGWGVQEEEVTHTLDCTAGPAVQTAMQVRRLTPVECERLQGFPDGYTAIPWRTYQEARRKGISYETLLARLGMKLRGPSIEDCPDGPRYKALGNSWAVPVIAWIGRRIARQLGGRT